MAISKECFYLGSEGYLGEPQESKILFLMREPNCGGKVVKENEFWFRDVVNGEKSGKTYFQKLGRIAALITGEDSADNTESWRKALRKAVNMNINPVCGKGRASEEYKRAKELFVSGPNAVCSLEVELSGRKEAFEYPNRWDAINQLPNDSVIVTVGDIYTILYEYILKHENKILINQGRHLEIRTDSGIRYMRSFVFAEGRKHITVMETYHPATLGRNRFQWNDLSIFRNNQS